MVSDMIHKQLMNNCTVTKRMGHKRKKDELIIIVHYMHVLRNAKCISQVEEMFVSGIIKPVAKLDIVCLAEGISYII